uniref:GPI mannosyltransferase 2 n=1 Tax=Trichuris muris TaxID=70415 RepID=A0A5S6QSS5_TRIMR
MAAKWTAKKAGGPASVVPLLLQSCISAWVFQFLFNHFVPDHNATAFRPPRKESSSCSASRAIDWLFSGYTRWDSQHFLHIATNGYTFENNAAFFPLLPGLIRLCNKALGPLVSVLHVSDYWLSVVSGVLLTNVAFILSGIVLYKFVHFLDGRDQFCRLCVVLHCLSPATVFLHSVYSESLFTLLTYAGLDALFRKRQPTVAALLFSLSVATRSNGVTNILFLFFYYFQDVFGCSISFRSLTYPFICALIRKGVSFISSAAFVLMPFLLYQLFVYWRFCLNCPAQGLDNYSVFLAYGQEKGYSLLCQLDRLDWCHNLVPLSYGVIQKRYWNVGLFGYYKWRKLPCFLLSLPTLCLFCSVLFRKISLFGRNCRRVQSVLVLHSCFLVCYVYTCCNVEISTRLLFSSSPLLYWQAARIIDQNCRELSIHNDNLMKCILALWKCSSFPSLLVLSWFLAYAVGGIALHCNFLPWT